MSCDCEVLRKRLPSPGLQGHSGVSREKVTPLPALFARGKSGGTLKYAPCRTTVYAPTGWKDPPDVNDPPATRLTLEFMYFSFCSISYHSSMGYKGNEAQDNIHFLKEGPCDECKDAHEANKIAYFSAATCIVMDIVHGEQRFYNGHYDDVYWSTR
jgi:hypothetical protein